MKVTRLGLEWGAAFEEATPIRITHGEHCIEVFVSERHTLIVRAYYATAQIFTDREGRTGLEIEA